MPHIILFFVSTLFVLASYVLFFSSKFENRTDIFIAGFTFATFQIIAVELLLGIFGLLTRPYVVSFNLIVSALLLLFSFKKIDWQKFSFSIHPHIKSIKTMFILEILLISYGLIIFLALIIPPYAWDSITYHLMATFSWIKAKRLILVHSINEFCFFPMNGELIMLWTYLTSKNMHLLNLIQTPFAFVLALSTYSLAKKLNIHSAPKVIPIILLTPVIMLQCTIEYVDVIFACFVIASLNFIVGYARTRKTDFFILSCIALGLTGGIKPAGFLAIIASMALFIFARRQKLNIKFLLLGFILMFAGGGFWYVRNFVLTLNPLFPFTIKIFDLELFKGVIELGSKVSSQNWFVENKWEWMLYPFFEKVRGELTYSIENGFGMQFVLGLVSFLYAFYLAAIKKDRRSLLIFLIFPATIFFWLKTSTDSIPRYVLFLCSITAIAIAYVCDNMIGWQKKIMDTLIFYSLVFSFIVSLPILIPHQSRVLSMYFEKGKPLSYEYHKWVYGELADAWEWIDRNLPSGSVIAYSYTELTTPLYGRNLQNDVVHIVTYDTPYKGSPTARTYEEWKRLLSKNNVSYFFAYIPSWNPKAKSPDFEWAKTHPEEFIKLAGWGYRGDRDKDAIVIYKVK